MTFIFGTLVALKVSCPLPEEAVFYSCRPEGVVVQHLGDDRRGIRLSGCEGPVTFIIPTLVECLIDKNEVVK